MAPKLREILTMNDGTRLRLWAPVLCKRTNESNDEWKPGRVVMLDSDGEAAIIGLLKSGQQLSETLGHLQLGTEDVHLLILSFTKEYGIMDVRRRGYDVHVQGIEQNKKAANVN